MHTGEHRRQGAWASLFISGEATWGAAGYRQELLPCRAPAAASVGTRSTGSTSSAVTRAGLTPNTQPGDAQRSHWDPVAGWGGGMLIGGRVLAVAQSGHAVSSIDSLVQGMGVTGHHGVLGVWTAGPGGVLRAGEGIPGIPWKRCSVPGLERHPPALPARAGERVWGGMCPTGLGDPHCPQGRQ